MRPGTWLRQRRAPDAAHPRHPVERQRVVAARPRPHRRRVRGDGARPAGSRGIAAGGRPTGSMPTATTSSPSAPAGTWCSDTRWAGWWPSPAKRPTPTGPRRWCSRIRRWCWPIPSRCGDGCSRTSPARSTWRPSPPAIPAGRPGDVAAKVEALRQAGPEVVGRTLGAIGSIDTRPWLAELGIPTLLIGADPAVGALVSAADGEAAARSARSRLRDDPGRGALDPPQPVRGVP